MKKFFTASRVILFWIYIFATFIPIYALVSDFIRIPILNFILASFIAGIPIVNCIVGIIGAVQIWNLSILSAILFYIAPFIICLVYVSFCSMNEKH